MVKRGLPTVILVNENFITETKVVAKSRGVPDLPYVVLPQNVAVLPKEELEAIARRIPEQIVAALLKPARRVS